MTAHPTVSIMLCVHNGGAYLLEALESIWAQTFSSFELIVVDDASTDHTPDILTRVSDARLRVITLPQQHGIATARQIALEASQGIFIAILDADDRMHPERLQHQVAYLEQHAEVGILGSWVRTVDATGKRGPLWRMPAASEAVLISLPFFCPLVNPSVMYRKSLVTGYGGYTADCPVEDYDLWGRLMLETKMANLPKALTDYRLHDNNFSIQQMPVCRQAAVKIAFRIITMQLGVQVPEEIIRYWFTWGQTRNSSITRTRQKFLTSVYKSLESKISCTERGMLKRRKMLHQLLLFVSGSLPAKPFSSESTDLNVAWRFSFLLNLIALFK